MLQDRKDCERDAMGRPTGKNEKGQVETILHAPPRPLSMKRYDPSSNVWIETPFLWNNEKQNGKRTCRKPR
jgi:hypothetical protein